ncbi:MAG: hypothetical protein HY802_02985 [Methanobacterium sp.]|nr:hypothetical protein [Methanobacterium sp.]
MSPKISSIGLVLLVLIVIVISGCTSQNGIKETESGSVKHFEGKNISFDAPNTWYSGILKNSSGYLFSIYIPPTENNSYTIDFYAGYSNKTLFEAVNPFRNEVINANWTIISEKELTVDGLPAYQMEVLNQNGTLISTFVVKNGVVYGIYAIPRPDSNLTSIEPDLEMVLNTFHIL